MKPTKEKKNLYMSNFRKKHPNVDKEFYRKNREKIIDHNLSYYYLNKVVLQNKYKILKNEALALVGQSCCICNIDKNIVFHRKDNVRHNETSQYVLKNVNLFVSMCRFHHGVLHSYLKYLEKFDILKNEAIK